jgi:D-sedoheptulose 7-phosphate isomerase
MLDLDSYYEDYARLIKPRGLVDNLRRVQQIILRSAEANGKLIIAGNGASAAIAAHASLDFTKQAKVRSITLNDPTLITAYANDYGGENWLLEAVKCHVDKNDVVIFISVSGESPNLVKAARWLFEKNIKVVSFTGINHQTSLAKYSSTNLWVDSNAYNIVECIHMIWITSIVDMVIGKKVYSVGPSK